MPRIVDHDRQRDDLVDALLPLLLERGYAGASMRQLALAGEVSTGTLYHYFPTKRAILVHMFERRVQLDQARLQAVLDADADTDTRLRAFLAFVRSNAEDLRDLLRLALELVRHEPEPTSRAEVVRAVRLYRRAISEVLKVPDDTMVAMLFSLVTGTLVHGLLDPEAIDFDALEGAVLVAWQALGPVLGVPRGAADKS